MLYDFTLYSQEEIRNKCGASVDLNREYAENYCFTFDGVPFIFKDKIEVIEHADDDIDLWVEENNVNASYWVSIDKNNRILKYGKGEMRKETTLVSIKYAEVPTLLNQKVENEYEWIDSLQFIHPKIRKSRRKIHGSMRTSAYPVVVNAPRVVSTDISVSDIGGKKVPPSSLSKECQTLYGNVSQFALEHEHVNMAQSGERISFSDFGQAVEYSLRTKGGIANLLYQYKIDHPEFDSDTSAEGFKQSYLRITLGRALGQSPGIPYVMEIWPYNCGSPIHDHGNTHAIIKALRGSIDIELFRMLPQNDTLKPFDKFTVQEGEVTYIMPTTNQFHRLSNPNGKTCITIQCYSYGDRDREHYPYFNYSTPNGKQEGHFNPISDCDFNEFKAKIFQEWNGYLESFPPQ
jgi:hypothetical protein